MEELDSNPALPDPRVCALSTYHTTSMTFGKNLNQSLGSCWPIPCYPWNIPSGTDEGMGNRRILSEQHFLPLNFHHL